MQNIDNSLFLRALRRQPVERTPVWIMRQAGRYLPEYRKVREGAGDFLSLCKNPELACEVTLQPLRRYELDAAILFSDILTIPDAMGLGLRFAEGEGPIFEKPLRDVSSINQLRVPDMAESLGYVMDAVRLIRREMPAHLPLIGFAGSPWTLACYMVEGRGSRDFKRVIELAYSNSAVMFKLLDVVAQSVALYLKEQIKAGVQAVMIFDTWGGMLPAKLYEQCSLHYMQKITQAIKAEHANIPVILFTKGGGLWLEKMAATGCDALGIDWTLSLQEARQRAGHIVALQGNMHPAVLLGGKEVIHQQVKETLDSFGKGPGHVFNLGHGITPDVPPESVSWMIDAVRELSLV